jgi:hypothetical protein
MGMSVTPEEAPSGCLWALLLSGAAWALIIGVVFVAAR